MRVRVFVCVCVCVRACLDGRVVRLRINHFVFSLFVCFFSVSDQAGSATV